MPHDNDFRHQRYDREPADTLYEVPTPTPPLPVDSAGFAEEMAAAGRALRRLRISQVALVHGSFTGNDLTGLIRMIERLAPDTAHRLATQEKRLADSLIGDLGNFSESFADILTQGLNQQSGAPIEVKRFEWSSQNNHSGRADAAIRLFLKLEDWRVADERRFLLWTYSHGGNVAALLSHLLGGSTATFRDFLAAVRPYFNRGWWRRTDDEIWLAAAEYAERPPRRGPPPDIVTFGTPVRYGWETGGYRTLTHFVHHRPQPGHPPWQAPFPPTWEQVTAGSEGDFLQQFGIAGTNFPVNLLAWWDYYGEERLQRLLQRGHRRRQTWERLKRGIRIHAEGHTFVVDYHKTDAVHAAQLLGHGIYTLPEWLPFHLRTLIHQLESTSSDA